MDVWALKSQKIVSPTGILSGAVLIRGDAIADIVGPNDIPNEYRIEDAGNSVLMPGLVDTHVHINEPGHAEWEGFKTATVAAAAGGITTLLDMPLNSLPVTTHAAALASKRKAAEGKLFIDCGFVGGVIPGNKAELGSLACAGVFAFKAFLIHSGLDEFPNVEERDLHEALPTLAQLNLPLLVHAELDDSSGKKNHAAPKNQRAYRDYLASRPRSWENAAVSLMIRLAKQYGCRVHIVHLSSSEALPLLERARGEGIAITAETCPHYLCFDSDHISDGNTLFKCAPPIRDSENREQLWEALKSGTLDFIVSDHSPCSPELKRLREGDFKHAWGGISSLQLTLPAVWTEASRRGFSVENIAAWMASRPAAFAGLVKKGKIASGCDADFVVWDPDAAFMVEASRMRTRHKQTPYAGRTLRGIVKQTYLRGRKIYDNGELIGRPRGQALAKPQ